MSGTTIITVMLYLTLILGLTTTTLAQTAAKESTCCGLMSGKIYCYGGLVYTSATESQVDNAMNVLDLTNKNGTASDELQNLWQNITYDTDYNVYLTPRTDPQCVVISEQNRMIINGGFVAAAEKSPNMNFMYNALQNKFVAQAAYTEAPYGSRQIFWGSGSYVPGKGAAFYGGYEEFINPNWTVPNANASIFTASDGFSRFIGYTQVSFFNADSPTSTWNTPVSLATASDQFSARHQSVFDPVTNMLLFMGGEYRTTTSPTPIPRSFSYIKTFNAVTYEWGMLNLTGDIPTSNRNYFTLTLLPSTGRHVLMYGGEANDAVVQDYCYVLNLDTKAWSKQAIDAPAGTTLQRSRHSSVLVNNNTLFVMWGVDTKQEGISSMLILNTTNPNAITISNNYIEINAANATRDSNGNTVKPGNGNTTEESVTKGLGSGATAGIVVAAVVVVILGALVIVFYLRHKKEKLRHQEHELRHQQQVESYKKISDVEPMEVDWDQIETKYAEFPATKSADKNNQFGAGGDAVHPDVAEMHRPNVMDSSPQPPRALKPDGGY